MKVIIFGSKGMLGSELLKQLHDQEVYPFDTENLDITDQLSVRKIIQELKPDIIFNCAAYNNADKAEQPEERDKVYSLNSNAVGYIAEAAEEVGAILIHYSTGFVFEGNSESGYNESDSANPQSVYAQSKFEGEERVLKTSKYYLIRLNLLFGKGGTGANAKQSFPDLILSLAKERKVFDFVDNEVSTPTYASDLAEASIRLVKQGYPFGIYHLPNSGRASWYDFGKEVFKIKGVNAKINPIAAAQFKRAARRPANSVLINNKFPALRDWREALKAYLDSNI